MFSNSSSLWRINNSPKYEYPFDKHSESSELGCFLHCLVLALVNGVRSLIQCCFIAKLWSRAQNYWSELGNWEDSLRVSNPQLFIEHLRLARLFREI